MTREELKNLKQTIDYFGHWYDVIGEERVLILEKSIKYIEELERENKELKTFIEDEHKVGNSKFWRNVWYSIKRNIELERENAELKEELKNYEDLATVAYMQGADNQKKKYVEQLAKAKELLITYKDFLEYEGLTTRLGNLYDRTVRFLKELEDE